MKALKLLYPGQSIEFSEKLQSYAIHLYTEDDHLSSTFIRNLSGFTYALNYFQAENLSGVLTRQSALPSILKTAIQKHSPLALLMLEKRWVTHFSGALHAAVEYRYPEVIQYFIDHKISLNEGVYTRNGSPLHSAVLKGALPIVVMLIQGGADCCESYYHQDSKYSMSLLSYAILSEGWETVIEALLARSDYDVNIPDDIGNLPLHHAVDIGHLNLVRTLLEKGAHKNFLNEASRAPIHIAVESDSREMIRLLAEFGTNLNARDRDQCTPLALAYRRNYLRCVVGLIYGGADFRAESILQQAQAFNHYDVIYACLEMEPNLYAIEAPLRNQILCNLLAHANNPKVYEKQINRLVLFGASLPNLLDFYKNHSIVMTLPELMEFPHLYRVQARYGFENLCQMCRVQSGSVEALRLFAVCVETFFRSCGNAKAEEIKLARAEPTLHRLCATIQTQAPSQVLSYLTPAVINPWSDLPDSLKNLVRQYALPPESPVSRKRSYQAFSG